MCPSNTAGSTSSKQESFKNLTVVLLMAALLVFAVLILEFGTVFQPLAIVAGSALALFGVVGALWSQACP